MGKKESAKKEAVAKKAAASVSAQNNSVGGASELDVHKKKSLLVRQSARDVRAAVNTTYRNYINTLTGRLKLIDSFLVFLVGLGVLQFAYVLIIGNFPFNAFLGGFIACVGQFVLTVSLRLQYGSVEPGQRGSAEKAFTITPERALGDYVFASLILHFIVFHFIN